MILTSVKKVLYMKKSRPAKQVKPINVRRLEFSLQRSGNEVYIHSRNADIQLYMLCCTSPPRVKTGIAFFPISLDTALDRKRQRAAVDRFIEAYPFRPQIRTELLATEKKHSAGKVWKTLAIFPVLWYSILATQFNIFLHEVQFCDFVLLIFSCRKELCRNNAKYIFGVCFTLLRHTFFMLILYLKRFFKKVPKTISAVSITDTPI